MTYVTISMFQNADMILFCSWDPLLNSHTQQGDVGSQRQMTQAKRFIDDGGGFVKAHPPLSYPYLDSVPGSVDLSNP